MVALCTIGIIASTVGTAMGLMATHVEAGWLALNVFSLAINTILLVSHGRWK